jgi:hypothetical protein
MSIQNIRFGKSGVLTSNCKRSLMGSDRNRALMQAPNRKIGTYCIFLTVCCVPVWKKAKTPDGEKGCIDGRCLWFSY